jgi:hypothetical protein
MRPKNHDLIQLLVFKNESTPIILEIVFNLQVETISFQFNNQPLDVLFFPNDKVFIKINPMRMTSFPFQFDNKHGSDLFSTKSIYLSTRITYSYRFLLRSETKCRLPSLIEDNGIDIQSCLQEYSFIFLQSIFRVKCGFDIDD